MPACLHSSRGVEYQVMQCERAIIVGAGNNCGKSAITKLCGHLAKYRYCNIYESLGRGHVPVTNYNLVC